MTPTSVIPTRVTTTDQLTTYPEELSTYPLTTYPEELTTDPLTTYPAEQTTYPLTTFSEKPPPDASIPITDLTTANKPDTTSHVTSLPTDIPQDASVHCSDNTMTVYIQKTIMPNVEADDLHLVDDSCAGTDYNDTHIRVLSGFDQCGTVMEVIRMITIFKQNPDCYYSNPISYLHTAPL